MNDKINNNIVKIRIANTTYEITEEEWTNKNIHNMVFRVPVCITSNLDKDIAMPNPNGDFFVPVNIPMREERIRQIIERL